MKLKTLVSSAGFYFRNSGNVTNCSISDSGILWVKGNMYSGRVDSTYTSGEGGLQCFGGGSTHRTYIFARNVADTSNVFEAKVNNGLTCRITAAGNAYNDGVWSTSNADYAEYFEWSDGNPNDEDRVGMSVSMVGNQIKIAEEGDVVMGIVSARPAVVGDSASLGWQGKWETDEYGRRIQQDITVYSWTEQTLNEDAYTKTIPAEFDEEGNEITPETTEEVEATYKEENREYRHDAIPEGVTVPDDATSVIRQEDKPSIDFDADADYVPRSDRKEWSAIGLMGKLKLRTGQVTDSRWVKMRDMSDTIEEWLVR